MKQYETLGETSLCKVFQAWKQAQKPRKASTYIYPKQSKKNQTREKESKERKENLGKEKPRKKRTKKHYFTSSFKHMNILPNLIYLQIFYSILPITHKLCR